MALYLQKPCSGALSRVPISTDVRADHEAEGRNKDPVVNMVRTLPVPI
jgi:hypothetical protein